MRTLLIALWGLFIFVIAYVGFTLVWDTISTGECLYFDYNERHFPSTEWWVEYCSNHF